MKKEKTIGGTIAFVVVTILALPFYGIDIPIPSSYVELLFFVNAIFAFVSIFLQRLVIILYEANVFEKPKGTIDYAFKYFAIYSSGVNYYVQMIYNRLPFILNKLLAIIFFLYMVLVVILIGDIF